MRLASLTDKDFYTWSTKFIALSKKGKTATGNGNGFFFISGQAAIEIYI